MKWFAHLFARKRSLILVLAASVASLSALLVGYRVSQSAQFPDHPQADAYARTMETLRAAMETEDGPLGKSGGEASRVGRLRDVAKTAIASLPEKSYYRLRLGEALRACQMRAASDPRAAANELRAELRSVLEDMQFEPIAEADMPEGFPAPTPVGEVEVKDYPTYRKAETGDSGGAFWTLFQHIKKNEIAMTAPVEMQSSVGDGEGAAMAFLYGSTRQGATGQQGEVEVLDVPAQRVISTGVRGRRSEADVKAAQARLEAWLAEFGGDLEVAGLVRVMGYNSPFVPRGRQYFEVQIPVQPVENEGTEPANASGVPAAE